MPDAAKQPLDLLFLGSGNAFAAEGRAFSSFLLNGRYLFDCGPTVLQQLTKAGLKPADVEYVFISHFHADHFFGLPFLMLDGKHRGRVKELKIVGPPGIESQTEQLLRLGYPHTTHELTKNFKRRYVEVSDGCTLELDGITLSASQVRHVDEFCCFAYHARVAGRTLVYSGDTTLCAGLLKLVSDAEVIVVECSCGEVPVHLGPSDIATVQAHARPDARFIVTHLDGLPHPDHFAGLTVAQDLWRYRL